MLKVENVEDSFNVINSKSKPLAAYLFTDDEQLKKDFVQNISAGAIVVNDAIIHVIFLYPKLIVIHANHSAYKFMSSPQCHRRSCIQNLTL